MEYRELGKTGEKIPTIGMGTWRIGSYSSADEREQRVRALKRGIELGATLIDTAEMYQSGLSEEVVRDAVNANRKEVFIATKVSPDHLYHEDVLSACEGSLRRLGTSYIDLYQVHWPNPRIPIEETMRAMQELVDRGKVRFVGVSNFDVEETEAARQALPRSDLVSNQVQYSITSREAEDDILPYCAREKLTLIAYTPLARGNIPRGTIPNSILDKYHFTPVQAALNWVTRSEHVVAIPKAAQIEHLEEDVASVSVRLTEEEYDLISKA